MTAVTTRVDDDAVPGPSGPAAGAAGLSHQDIDFVTKTERVLAVLDNTIQRSQLALCLPLLLRHNATLLRPILAAEQLAAVLSACGRYYGGDVALGDPPSSTMASYHASTDSQQRRAGASSQTSQQDSQQAVQAAPGRGSERWSSAMGLVLGAVHPDARQDPAVSRALNILWDNAEVRDMVKTRLLPLVSSAGAVFLEYLVRLRHVAAERLPRSPDETRAREAELCAAWRGGQQLETDREHLEGQLRAQADQLGAQVADKARAIALLRHNVNVVRRQCQEEVKLIVNKSERSMVLEWRNSEYRQENLRTELSAAREKMSATLAAHLAEEKELRVKRHKMETLLLTWLQKFDTDVGEKFQEHQELTEEYEAEAQQMQELTERMESQDAEYHQLLAEKERYEKEEEDELVYSLASKRAARVIQREWRAYRLRKRLAKAAKKKGKGKGKGKGKSK